MRRSTLAVLLLAGLAVAACAKKQSLYLDSGRSDAAPPAQHASAAHPTPPSMAGHDAR